MTLESFPVDPEGKKVLGALYGGIGDVLMIANTCSPLCDFTMCAAEYQRPILERIVGCKTESLEYYKDRTNHQNYHSVVNFMYFLTGLASLKMGGYYSILEKKIGHSSPLAGFDVKAHPSKGIYVHMTASNPNRDWDRDKWKKLLTRLARLDEVYLLGRKVDFSVEGPNIYNLAESSELLVDQMDRLRYAKCFVGIDSGFCHIAGILGVPGNVLFFNTKGEDVLERYPTLNPIDKFEGLEPSRSLKVGCETSKRFKEALSVDEVYSQIVTRYN